MGFDRPFDRPNHPSIAYAIAPSIAPSIGFNRPFDRLCFDPPIPPCRSKLGFGALTARLAPDSRSSSSRKKFPLPPAGPKWIP